jgi:hypothetical protein
MMFDSLTKVFYMKDATKNFEGPDAWKVLGRERRKGIGVIRSGLTDHQHSKEHRSNIAQLKKRKC